MRNFPLLGLPTLGFAHVYDTTDLRSRLPELIHSEAEGWAVPIPADPETEAMVWFSTELGNGYLGMGPSSELPLLNPILLSLDSSGLVAMKLIKPESIGSGIEEWHLINDPSHWTIESKLQIDGRDPIIDSEAVVFDLGGDDIELEDQATESLQASWPVGTTMRYSSRLFVACEQLFARSVSISIGTIDVEIRELPPYFAGKFAEMESSGWCPTNVAFAGKRRVVGARAILEQYDLVMDASNQGIIVLPKSSFGSQLPPLSRYRVDHESASWRWNRAAGTAKTSDFVITKLDTSARIFGVQCLAIECVSQLTASPVARWMGKPEIIISPDSIEVIEHADWIEHKLQHDSFITAVSISLFPVGRHMKRDDLESIDGKVLIFTPVTGPYIDGEFTIAEWPFFDAHHIVLAAPPKEEFAVLPPSRRWLGKPRIQTMPYNNILITAEGSEWDCDRQVEIAQRDELSIIDFSVELCRYRQVRLGGIGYAFEQLGRSQSDPSEFVVKTSEAMTDLLMGNSYTWQTLAGDDTELFVPSGRWLGEPVFNIVKNSASRAKITITPSGQGGWTYLHKWEMVPGIGAQLVFYEPHRRVLVPQGLSLTDPVWNFEPATGPTESFQVTISARRWMSHHPDGGFALRFEDVPAPLFTGETRATYRGVPRIGFAASGGVKLRSSGDQRFEFTVSVVDLGAGRIDVRFTPNEFSSVASYPVIVDSAGERCPLCLDDFEPSETIAETKCKHRFHLGCLRRVENKKCPFCRSWLYLI